MKTIEHVIIGALFTIVITAGGYTIKTLFDVQKEQEHQLTDLKMKVAVLESKVNNGSGSRKYPPPQ